MKPIYLEINYFGPHEHSIIDFRKLDESPIFLIGGDTGAGKSTIFDAMTFALFNTTTGDRDAKEMRSQFATGADKTKVIFYFEQNGKIYKIERTPEQYLNKKNGTGSTKRTPTANLSVVEDVGGVEIESIATKPVDVGHGIAEILNLNADQFKKIILLPQNDFSEFLKSKTNDKEKILKKIFGTQLFTDFTANLKEHFDQANAKATDFNNNIQSQIKSPIWTESEQTELKQIPNDQLLETIKQYIKSRQNTLKLVMAEENKISESWQKADRNYHAAQDIQKNFDRLADSKEKYQINITNRANEIKKNQQHIIELQWAKPLREIVRDLNKSKSAQKDVLTQKQNITDKLNISKQKLDEAKSEIASLTNQTDDFKAKKDQAQKLTVLISKVQDIEKIESELENLQPKLKTATSLVNDKKNALTNLQNEIADYNQQLLTYKDLPTQKDALIKNRSDFIDTFTPLENTRTATAQDVTAVQSKLAQLHENLSSKSQVLIDAKKDYQTKIKTRQSLMIAQLRQELTENQPCPVCGSTEHPLTDNQTVADETELRKAMDEVDDSQKFFAATDNDVKNIQKNIDDLSEEFDQKQLAAVKAQVALSTKYNELIISSKTDLPQEFDLEAVKTSFQDEIDKLDSKIKESQTISQTIKELEEKQVTTQKELSKVTSEFDKLSTQIDTRNNDLTNKLKVIDNPDISSQQLIEKKETLTKEYEKFDADLKAAQEALHSNEIIYSNNQTKLTDIQSQLEQQTITINELSKKLNQALSSQSAKTNDLDTLDNWILELDQDLLSKLQNGVTSYAKEKELLQATINDIQNKLLNVEKPDLSKLKEIANAAQLEQKAAINQTATAKRDLQDAESGLETIQKIMQQQGAFAKELASITSLYNIVNGKDGNKNKLKLETYVVQNYLQRILTYANATFLNRLSHNRYSFIISQEPSNKQTDHGLDINVYDRETNAIRSSNTLSGGETFIAALSIALSLSEVVQSSANGVQIDALFVDEGFGSLDDETLDEAMSALEDIGQNRMVGVISHIESMKQSIGQQLLVKKLGDGKSKIELINK